MCGSQNLADEHSAQGVLEIVGPDLDALLRFYLECGFTLQRRSESFAVVAWSERQLLFLAGNPKAPTTPRWAGLRILVDDIHGFWQKAQSLNWPIQHPLDDRGYGMLDFSLVDPAGFTLRFAQPLSAHTA